MRVSGLCSFALKGLAQLNGGQRGWPYGRTQGVFVAPTKESNRYPLFELAAGAPDT